MKTHSHCGKRAACRLSFDPLDGMCTCGCQSCRVVTACALEIERTERNVRETRLAVRAVLP